jgi:hypothetical protein
MAVTAEARKRQDDEAIRAIAARGFPDPGARFALIDPLFDAADEVGRAVDQLAEIWVGKLDGTTTPENHTPLHHAEERLKRAESGFLDARNSAIILLRREIDIDRSQAVATEAQG